MHGFARETAQEPRARGQVSGRSCGRLVKGPRQGERGGGCRRRCYRCERRGRNLIQARIAMMATSSQGENKMCTVKLSTVKATMAMRTKAMIASMMVGLHSLRVVCVLVWRERF